MSKRKIAAVVAFASLMNCVSCSHIRVEDELPTIHEEVVSKVEEAAVDTTMAENEIPTEAATEVATAAPVASVPEEDTIVEATTPVAPIVATPMAQTQMAETPVVTTPAVTTVEVPVTTSIPEVTTICEEFVATPLVETTPVVPADPVIVAEPVNQPIITEQQPIINSSGYYKVQWGDCRSIIAESVDLTEEELMALNPTYEWDYLMPGDFLVVSKVAIIASANTDIQTSTGYYEIQRGDYPYLIADNYNTTLEELYALNPTYEWEYLMPGDIISVPVQEVPVAEPVQEAVEVEPVQEAVEAEPVQEAVEAEPVQEAVEVEPVQEAVEAEPVQEAVEAEPVQETVVAEPVQETVVAEPVQEAVETESVQDTVVAESVQEADEAEPVQETVVAEPVQEAVETESVQDTVEAEPLQDTVVDETTGEESSTEARSADCIEQEILRLEELYPGINIAVGVYAVDDGTKLFGYNEYQELASGCTVKAAYALYVLKTCEEQGINIYTETLPYLEGMKNSGSGWIKNVHEYGDELTIDYLLSHLLQISDNTAYNILAARFDMYGFQNFLWSIGGQNLYGVMYGVSSPEERKNEWLAIWDYINSGSDYSSVLQAWLSNGFATYIANGFSDTHYIIHKSGWKDEDPAYSCAADCCIVDERYIVCVITQDNSGVAHTDAVASLGGAIENFLYFSS